MNDKKPLDRELKREIAGIVIIALAVLSLISILTYSPNDPPNSGGDISNFIGFFGAYSSYALLWVLGNLAYLVPFVLFYWGVLLLFNNVKFHSVKISAVIMFVFFLGILLEFHAVRICPYPIWDDGSGALPVLFRDMFKKLFGIIGAHWVLSIGMLIAAIMFFRFQMKKVLPVIGNTIVHVLKRARVLLCAFFVSHTKPDSKKDESLSDDDVKTKPQDIVSNKPVKEVEYFYVSPAKNTMPAVIHREKSVKEQELPFGNGDTQVPVVLTTSNVHGKPDSLLPPVELLNYIEKKSEKEDTDTIARLLEESLAHFDIKASTIGVNCGPMASLYEMSVERGTKINKLESLDRELALMLSKDTVRIIAPLPGRGTIGIEVPNARREFVSLRELVESKQFTGSSSPLAIGFGLGMDGKPIIVHLEELPHLLIAGATMSGKSIGIHTIIMSLLFKTPCTELRLILIDPKRLEFPYYNGIPHLLTNVIVEPAEAVNTLKWALFEMDRRYKLLAHEGARDIQSYNTKYPEQKLPYLVIVIDELADLMMTTGPDTENAIIRLAQMARAVGIHLVLATQRPSADVITGTIKANFPSRIAYKTASKSNSRIILDENGAESLLGKGDFLYLKITGELLRGQGALVTVPEIIKTVQYLKQIPAPNDSFSRVFSEQREVKLGDVTSKDELYTEALRIVYNNLSSGNDTVSISLIQRKLSIGYNRAARIIEDLEADNIIDMADGAKPRTIIADIDSLDELLHGSRE